MAFVKDVFIATGTNPSVTIDYSASLNDFMFLVHSRRYGNAPTTPTGWTALTYTSIISNGFRNDIWFRRAGSSEPTSITISSTGTRQDAHLVVCEGVDVTTALDVAVTSRAGGNATTATAPAITPVSANTLILYLAVRSDRVIAPIPGLLKIARNDVYSYYTYGEAGSVTVPSHDFYSERDETINPTIVTISLRDNGSNVRKGYIDVASPPAQILHLLGRAGETGHLTDTATIDFTSTGTSVITSLQGVTTEYKNTTGEGFFEQGFQSAGYSTNFVDQDCALNGSSTNVSYDVENDLISFTGSGSPGLYNSYDSLSKHFLIGDGTNFRAWRVDALNTVPTGSENTLTHVIEVDGGFETEEFGTVNATVLQNIDNYAYGGPGIGSYQANNWGFLYKLNTMTIIGGSTSKPADMNTGVECAKTTSLRTVSSQNQQSQTQFFCAQKIRVGDGSRQTVWKSSQHSLEWPGASSVTERRVQIQISAGLLGFSILASSSDNIDFSTTTFNMGNFNVWELESGTSTSATYSEAGALIISGEVILRAIGRAIGGMTFTACQQITQNTAVLTGGNTFDSCVDTNCIVVTSEVLFESLHNCTFTNNNRAIQINGNQTGTWDDPNFTVSGNTFDIEYTGTSDFSIASANALTVNNASSGTLTIVTPILTLNINSDTAATDIRYFEDDSQTVVDSATGITLAYNFPDTDVIDIELVKQSYVPVNRQDVTPFDGDFNIIMDFDESYNSGHGLTITSEYDYVRATKVLTINSDQSALDVRSSLADVIRTNTSYFNTPLLMMSIPGLTRVDLTDGMTITSMATWKGAGMEMFDATDSANPLEKWFALKSGGGITGSTTHFRQTDSGNSTAVTLTNNVVDEAFQYFDDPNHDGSTADGFDFSDYMVTKAFLAGSKQARSDLLVDVGISAIASNSYQIVLANEAHGYSGSDPGVSGDITLIAGGTFGGEVFAYEWVDGGTTSGVDIADQINFNGANNPNAIIPGGTGLRWFELSDMVIHNATAVETERGFEEGTTPVQVGFYCSRGGLDHPGFTRFQADNGDYFTPAVTANAQTLNIVANSYLQVINKTAKESAIWVLSTAYVVGDRRLRTLGTGTELTAGLYMRCTTAGTSGGSEPTWDTTPGNTTNDNGVIWETMAIAVEDGVQSSDWSLAYTEGEEFKAGDQVRYRVAFEDGATYKFPVQAITIASSTGFTILLNQSDWDEVNAWAIDGSAETNWVKDGTNIDIDIVGSGSGTKKSLVAWWAFLIASDSEGIELFWDAYVVESSASIKQDVSVVDVVIEKTSPGNFQFTDNDIRYYRSDFSSPYDTTGNSIFMDYSGVPLIVETGVSGLTAPESAQLGVIDSVDSKIGTPNVDVSADIATRMPTTHIDATAGKVDGVALVDQTTVNDDMRGTDGANTVVPDNAGIASTEAKVDIVDDNVDAIKLKTDPLTFTKANELDSNIQSVNDVTVVGDGQEGTEWGS